MKYYPENKSEVNPDRLLIDYTLYPDLKFYEVSSDIFYEYKKH